MDNKNPIFRSLEIIEGKIMEKLTIENIASSIHFSKYYYQRMFRDIVGDSVMGYVTKRKLTLAGRKLLETNATILDIALMLGYDSHEGFTRSFKAYMGITPTEYRKYHLSAISLKTVKEKCTMLYSKTTDGIIRELNDFIVQAKDTADYTRKNKKAKVDTSEFYSQFWDFIAEKADAMADRLKDYLERITAISQHPDEISTRFIIIKAIEDIAFKSNITAFNAGLMISRATSEHSIAYKPICDKYYGLASAAQMKVGKIVEFFNELASLIFEDMRSGATQRIQLAIDKGKSAVTDLTSNSNLPYAYIADELTAIINELSHLQLTEITVSHLEDFVFRLHIISFASETDAMRAPSHKELLAGISVFQESINEVSEYFQSLSISTINNIEPTQNSVIKSNMTKNYRDLAFQGNILLFIVKGEIQKLGNAHLTEKQKTGFNSICDKLNKVILLAHRASDETSFGKMAAIIGELYNELLSEAHKLGLHGSAIKFIAEEIKHYAARVENLAKNLMGSI